MRTLLKNSKVTFTLIALSIILFIQIPWLMNQRKIENAKQREAKRIQELKDLEAKKIKELKDREAKKIKESKEREAKEKKANTSYLTAFLEIDYNIPNNFSVKVTEEGKIRGPAKQTPFMKAVQERKRKIADENQSNSVQPTKKSAKKCWS